MTDKSKKLNASIRLINDKLHFTGTVGNNAPVSIDYISPLGDDLGYTSLELLLLSLESCIGSAILTFLRRMGKTINDCEIHAKGLRREEHPTGFRQIIVDINITSPDVTEEDMLKVINLSEEKYCPVLAMIRGNTEVEINFQIDKMMEKLISCCGLNCAECEARIATLANDDKLRAETAEKWRVQFNAPEMPVEAINCTGCREPGVKLSHCKDCQVRNCVISKGYNTCADCDQLETCEIVSQIHKFAPSALENLKLLN
jgi:uncharacterized OsmC-like protein